MLGNITTLLPNVETPFVNKKPVMSIYRKKGWIAGSADLASQAMLLKVMLHAASGGTRGINPAGKSAG